MHTYIPRTLASNAENHVADETRKLGILKYINHGEMCRYEGG